MKKYLLPENGTFYKANLHCHTTLSDGCKTVQQIKDDYMKHGYSIIAYTDHDKYIPHNDMTDEHFLALNGVEVEYYKTAWRGITAHICLIAKHPDEKGLGYSDPDLDPFTPRLREGETPLEKGGGLYTVLPPYRRYAPEYINADIAKAKELGFFVTYNHPTWSLENYPQYSQYRGYDAMEIFNYDCICDGFDEDNGRVYKDILELNGKVGCIATDDNHNAHPDGDPMCDSYGGYTMIKAEHLDYASVIDALEKGNYYCSGNVNPGAEEAPQIKALWLEDGMVHIETGPAQNILFITGTRRYQRAFAAEGKPVCHAAFDPKNAGWFRLVVISAGGNKSYTNAYFNEELGL